MNKGDILANRYKVEKLIGQGGMADVYLAYDVLLERDVAIKILRNDLSSDAVSLLRFKHEAVAVSKLNHPNIIEIFDIGVHNSRQYIVMEYVSGKTLKDLINERGGIYKDEAVYIMKQLTSAISEAHKNEIIHRDIKPQNVLIKSDGSVIITDFGIALAENALQLTQKETVMGSVHYLAPELARGEKATYQSDIYALGIVFYELLSGVVPFTGETAVEIAMKHINKEMPSIKEFNPEINQSIENVIIKATFKNKIQRYKSAEIMLKDLETVFDDARKNEKKLLLNPDLSHDDTTKVISKLKTVENPKKKASKKQRNIIIGIVLSIFLIFTVILAFNRAEEVEEVNVPNIVGLTLEEAKEKLESEGLNVGIIDRDLDDELEENKVIKQTPRQNSVVEKGNEVNLLVSKGKYFVFEDYVGRDFDVVRLELENEIRVNVRKEFISKPDLTTGEIFSQSIEAGEKTDPNNLSEIKFVVVRPVEIIVPSKIYGMDVEEAKKLLEDMNVEVTTRAIDDESDEYIASQTPNRVERSFPTRNSSYTQTKNNAIVLYYYPKIDIPVEEKPTEDKPNEENPDENKPSDNEGNKEGN